MIILLMTSTVFLLTTAFKSVHLSQDTPIFFDDFESFISTNQLKTAYTVWEDGAVLDIALEKGHVNSGVKSLRVDVVGANPQTLSTSASIYHLLQFTESNWSEGTGIRLWVSNLSRFPLSLTFNFKEMRNEFWAISDDCIFYLENPDQSYNQQQGQYGNLIVPAFYKGFLIIPFEGFSVPEWNTAKGNQNLDLSQIESFSFGINITTTELQRLYIDDIQILSRADFNLTQISGNTTVEIPQTGEHREPYSLTLPPKVDTSSPPDPEWTIEASSVAGVKIDADGWLTIPAGTRPGKVTLSVDFPTTVGMEKTDMVVSLFDPNLGEAQVLEEIVVQDEIRTIENKNSAYLQFANQFESWASKNRTWFVLIAISGVLLLLIGITFLQNRLK